MAKWIKQTIAKRSRSPIGFGGQQVRSYVEGGGVKDTRTGVEADMDAVLDGDIDDFMRASLAARIKP